MTSIVVGSVVQNLQAVELTIDSFRTKFGFDRLQSLESLLSQAHNRDVSPTSLYKHSF